MKIYVTNIKVNSISNIGSFNIGKTIICRNQTTETEAPSEGVPSPATETSPANVVPATLGTAEGPIGVSPATVGATGVTPGSVGSRDTYVLPPNTP